jgi:hypothetical protein
MDAEIASKFAVLEATIARLEIQLAGLLAPKLSGDVVCMKEAAARLGISRHTMRRRAFSVVCTAVCIFKPGKPPVENPTRQL